MRDSGHHPGTGPQRSSREGVSVHHRELALARPRYGVSNLLRFDQALLPHLGDENVNTVTQGVLGPHWRISYVTGYVTGPGTDRDIWHADFPYNQRNLAHIPAPYPDVPMHLTTFWMLTDFTPENGATYVVPGSHRQQDHPRPWQPARRLDGPAR